MAGNVFEREMRGGLDCTTIGLGRDLREKCSCSRMARSGEGLLSRDLLVWYWWVEYISVLCLRLETVLLIRILGVDATMMLSVCRVTVGKLFCASIVWLQRHDIWKKKSREIVEVEVAWEG